MKSTISQPPTCLSWHLEVTNYFLGSEPEQKRQLISLTLQNLEIKDGLLSYEWVRPFDSVFVSAKSHTWGRLREFVRNELLQSVDLLIT